MPEWLVPSMQMAVPTFGDHGVPLLGVEVLEPGLVRVEGVWLIAEDRALVVTPDQFCIAKPNWRPVCMQGSGTATVFHVMGPVTAAVFSAGGIDIFGT